MCAADKCQAYNRSWSCPPACGTLEHFEELFTNYQGGIAFQTVGAMEDSFDFETIEATGKLHAQRLYDFANKANLLAVDLLFLSAGCCQLCKVCTYPDNPCRYPEKMFPSMEATGLLVSDVCIAANIPYNHGVNTISYTSCLLF